MNATVVVVRSHFKDWVELSKPRITLLVLITTFTGMWLAAGGFPEVNLVFFTLLGTALASGASGILNNYADRDIDRRMRRTQERALPSGRIRPNHALWLGLTMGLTSFLLLFFMVNPLTAWLAVFTITFYVVVYTLWLKRTSPWCTEVGGVAGALPPVIGWTAVAGEVGWPAVALFVMMFLWQPPHFWALALLRADEYARAGLPMLPVARGERVTKRRMLIYTVALLPASAALYWLGIVGVWFLAAALGLGAVYLWLTIDFVRQPVSHTGARRLFGFSILYLSALFIIMFVDCQCGGLDVQAAVLVPLLTCLNQTRATSKGA